MDVYDIDQSFSTDEQTMRYLALVELEIETTILDLREEMLTNELSSIDAKNKLKADCDTFDFTRNTGTLAIADTRLKLLSRKIALQSAMLEAVKDKILCLEDTHGSDWKLRLLSPRCESSENEIG